MNHTEALQHIMKRTGMTQRALADKLGLRSRSTVSMRMNRGSARLYNIVELLDAMGYEMVAMPKNGAPLSEDAFTLGREDYP